MLQRDQRLDLARGLDWDFTYVSEHEVFPAQVAGCPLLPREDWQRFDEPYRTRFWEHAPLQYEKNLALEEVRGTAGRPVDLQPLDRGWLSVVKLQGAIFALSEFACALGHLRTARFGRDSAWRTAAGFGALDALRHTELPLLAYHEMVARDRQFDWIHKCLHTDHWLASAARQVFDELYLASDPFEFAVGAHLVFDSGFAGLHFTGLSVAAAANGDRLFEKMAQSIHSDRTRRAQTGGAVVRLLMGRDPAGVQYLVDKWFWRCWLLCAATCGCALDYLAPLQSRRQSFRELVEEWIGEQFQRLLQEYGLARPWYWARFLESVEFYHHMFYVGAYTHRGTLWFDMPCPGPEERAWLARKYPRTWPAFAPLWERVAARWAAAGPGLEWYTQGFTPLAFCHLCQLPLCGGTPERNDAQSVVHGERQYIFCSEPCAWIFRQEPERYAARQSLPERMLAGEAPANFFELVRREFSLAPEEWGRDAARGRYPWARPRPADAASRTGA